MKRKRGDILMDVIQNHLVIVDTFTQKENYYSIAYIRLSEFEIDGFQPYYHRGIKKNCFGAYFRSATNKELEEVKRVIAVTLKKLTSGKDNYNLESCGTEGEKHSRERNDSYW